MSEQQERPVPVWHASVGDGYEPVQIGDMTYSDEEVLRAGGWVKAWIYGFRQTADSLPRRRRKRTPVRISYATIAVVQDVLMFNELLCANIGDCFQLGDSGRLIAIDKPAEGQVER